MYSHASKESYGINSFGHVYIVCMCRTLLLKLQMLLKILLLHLVKDIILIPITDLPIYPNHQTVLVMRHLETMAPSMETVMDIKVDTMFFCWTIIPIPTIYKKKN